MSADRTEERRIPPSESSAPPPGHRAPRHGAPNSGTTSPATTSPATTSPGTTRPGETGTTDREPADPGDGPGSAREAPTLLDQMGGLSGIVASAVPPLVFVVVQAVFSVLVASAIAAVGSALAVAGWRLVRGEPLQPAFSGLVGVVVCAAVAWHTGQAKGFFLLGIWTSLVYGGVFLVSVLAGWPLVGVIWHGINGEGQAWRRVPSLRRAYSVASLTWALVFGARYVVQRWLYDSTLADTWLGWVRLAMGLPLAAVAALVTVWAVRRAMTTPVEAPDRQA